MNGKVENNSKAVKSAAIATAQPRNVLEAILPVGCEHPITAQQITEIMGLSDSRVITREIARLRKARVPICASCDSNNSGYYIAKDAGELATYLCSLNKRRRELNKAYFELESVLDEWTGQTRIEEALNER